MGKALFILISGLAFYFIPSIDSQSNLKRQVDQILDSVQDSVVYVVDDSLEIQVDTVKTLSKRDSLRLWYYAEIGVFEDLGHNRGKRVDEYFKGSGLGSGHPWCGAFVGYGYKQNGVQTPPHYYRARSFAEHGIKTNEPQNGDAFTLWYKNLNRVGHVGFYDDRDGDFIITVEGNTSELGAIDGLKLTGRAIDRDGGQVRKKKRRVSTIYSFNNFIE